MPGVEQSVLYMKVTDALREPTPDKIAALSKTYNIADYPELLSLAVELSPLETVKWVIDLYETKDKDFNETDPKTGDTALHKAVVGGRVKIIRELMLNARIDDTIRNKAGLTAPELASSPDIEHVVSASENRFAENMAVRLKAAFKNHDIAELNKIYANPRVSETLNINGVDPDTGRTVLHDSAQSNDLRLVQFILAHGGDPLVRDRASHKLAEDMTTSEEIKKALNNSAKSKAILDQTHGKSAGGVKNAPPTVEGYLKKWTNITSGYKLRWFVLRNSELSYFKKPEEVKEGERFIRGSIGLRHAAVRLDSSEKNKFEIRTPSTRFHLKASHPAETNKWVWALQSAITFVRDEEKSKANTQTMQQPTPRGQAAGPAAASATQKPKQTLSTTAGAAGAAGAGSAGVSPIEGTDGLGSNALNNGSIKSNRGSISGSHRRNGSLALSVDGDNWLVNDLNTKGDEDDSEDDYADEAALRGPQISAESLIARLSAVKDLMTMLVFQVHDETMRDAITTAQGSIDVLSSDIVMLQRQAQAHLHQLKVELERGDKAQRSWASNYRDLELQCENLEGQLITLKKQGGKSNAADENDDGDDDDEFFDTMDYPQTSSSQKDQTKDVSKDDSKSNTKDGVKGKIAGMTAAVGITTGLVHKKNQDADNDNQGPSSHTDSNNAEEKASRTEGNEDGSEKDPDAAHTGAAGSAPSDKESTKKGETTEEKDVEAEATKAQEEVEKRIMEQKSFAGYEDPPRKKLSIDADNRPKLSLWGILKNLIGKDMTKMTLPVTFNECTSLLQRSAEDMEYVDLLDRAAEAVDDGGLRMAYVAAFAGSSYSSTVNRIAKPFNPLLGETYEYARPDMGYRMFAEQVSHHPPIGALIAESKTWDFYGESNVESKFYGRSFDINPLGLWYVNLRPNKGADVESELYSFRKLTSSVVGIMLGNPVVDNYGDMKITNHTTGVTAVITYKARGWRGSSAYKLQGKILDPQGNELWTMGGQWNDKIWAKKAGSDEKILLWEAHPRHRVPFNLTDFAITLNALPDRLKPWLPPTDTRLRPDQRAMEEGRYDDASDEKSRVEDKQREKRRERETQGVHYKPQWFKLEKHPVTGLDYYKPINEYWNLRAEKELADKGDIF